MGTPWHNTSTGHTPAWHGQLQCPPNPGLGSRMSAPGLTALQGEGLTHPQCAGEGVARQLGTWLLLLMAVSYGPHSLGPTVNGFSHCHARGHDPQVLRD